MLTGRQIREARLVLGWDQETMARRTALPVSVVDRAESNDGAAGLGLAQQIVLKYALVIAGIEFTPEGARLREGRTE